MLDQHAAQTESCWPSASRQAMQAGGMMMPANPAAAVPIHLIAAPAVSPDGKSMAFEWAEDLWTASTDGGEAKRLVKNPGRDAYPKFTPDGKRIVFSSDRTGSMQVFSMDGPDDSAPDGSSTDGAEIATEKA